MHRNRPVLFSAVAVAVALLSAAYSPAAVPEKAAAKAPTAAEAKAFVDTAEKNAPTSSAKRQTLSALTTP